MPLIPAHHIAILAALYAAEYIWRFLRQPEKKFISMGKAFAASLVVFVYVYIAFFATETLERQVLTRWSWFVFLSTHLFFIAQEHLMRKYIRH